MEHQENLFNQFKTAAEKSEPKDFPAMDKVWNRIEEKLDHTVVQKQSRVWQKAAVIASVLLFLSVVYQFMQSKESIPVAQKNRVVADSVITQKDTVVLQNETTISSTKEAIFSTEPILNEKLKSKEQATSTDKNDKKPESKTVVNNYHNKNEYGTARKSRMSKQPIYEAIVVREIFPDKKTTAITTDTVIKKKNPPLYVVDGKVVTDRNERMSKILNNPKLDLEDDEIEYILELKEPLYIIDNKYYSEAQLFGPNATSPYAPLHRQDIETISVLEHEEAIPLYGERGAKGVVLIKTKNGKPAVLSKKQ
jgi:hypothetical protein